MKPNKEQAAYFLPFVQAIAEGKRVQVANKGVGDWDYITSEVCVEWFTTSDYLKYDFRIPPEPTFRPWTAEEVPVGAQIRWKHTPNIRYLICGFKDNHLIVAFERSYGYSTEQVLKNCEHSTDGGKNWLPCGVQTES